MSLSNSWKVSGSGLWMVLQMVIPLATRPLITVKTPCAVSESRPEEGSSHSSTDAEGLMSAAAGQWVVSCRVVSQQEAIRRPRSPTDCNRNALGLSAADAPLHGRSHQGILAVAQIQPAAAGGVRMNPFCLNPYCACIAPRSSALTA